MGVVRFIQSLFGGRAATAALMAPIVKPSTPRLAPLGKLRAHLSVTPRWIDGGQPIFKPSNRHRPRSERGRSSRRKAARRHRALR